jgi:hypothetical protein
MEADLVDSVYPVALAVLDTVSACFNMAGNLCSYTANSIKETRQYYTDRRAAVVKHHTELAADCDYEEEKK